MALFRKKAAGKPGEWYYCLRHHRVEEGPECRALDRLGPYPSRTEAEHAMETAANRNVKWDNDARWKDDDPDAGSSGTSG